jgi:DNA ligase-associated metallophosphoesterase
MSLAIEASGERLILLHGKAVVWPRTASLIVTDLHLGKSAAFRTHGIPVPEATTTDDLSRLDKLVAEHRSQRLIILGDFFHSAAGRQPEMMDAVGDWRGRNSGLEIVLVPGNHDKRSGEPPARWNIRSVPDCWSLPPFAFCHEPREVAGSYVFAGHIHPAIALRENFGSGLRVPCFWFGQHRAVLPAFGSFTGTQVIRPSGGDRIFAVGPDEILALIGGRANVLP